MKFLNSILIAGSTNATMTASEASLADIKIRACSDKTSNALFDGSTFIACISDLDCDIKDDYHIFNHFDDSGEEIALIPECRSISAQPMAGFTCGSNPSLVNGTQVVVPNIPVTGYTDDRQITILKKGFYNDFVTAVKGYEKCPNHSTDTECKNILFFQNGCQSTRIENGLVIFEEPFNQQDGCMPVVSDPNGTDSWVEEHKIIIGYNDLVETLPGGLESKLDIHKFYEISCKVRKIGDVAVDIETELKTDNKKVEDSIETDFFINKYYGNNTSRRELNETEVIPFSPNADPNERFQFKIWSDHNDEYVHLESCELTLDGKESFKQEFINDGCVTNDWKSYFSNENRDSLINEDWFNMRPLLIGCKSKWHIDCTVASCKRGLKDSNGSAYEKFCKPDDECEDRYTATFMDLQVHSRKRKSVDESYENDEPAEDHVVMDLVHPCYFVDEQTTEYCADENTCWTLEQCIATFPDDFSNSDLDQIISKFIMQLKSAVQNHIDQALTTTAIPDITHDHIMESIQENASRVVDMKQTFDDAVSEIIRLIETL